MANTYTLIEAQTLSSTQASVTLGSGGSIPSTYTDLLLKVSSRTNASGNVIDLSLNVGNGTVDTGSNYNYVELTAIPSTSIIASGSGNSTKFNTVQTASSVEANTFNSVEIYIPNYTSSNKKSMSADAVTANSNSSVQLRLHAWLWNSTSAINIINLFPGSGSFISGSSFYLYGIKNS